MGDDTSETGDVSESGVSGSEGLEQAPLLTSCKYQSVAERTDGDDAEAPTVLGSTPISEASFAAGEQKRLHLSPPMYYPGSDEYFPADENWMTHVNLQWMHCLADGSYFHVESNTFYVYDEALGTFSVIPGDEAAEEGEDTAGYDAVEGAGATEEDAQQATWAEEEYAAEGEDVEGANEEADGEEFFYMDFAKDIVISTADLLSNIKGKSEREDRHVTKERLPLDVVADSEACCFYSAIFDGHGGAVCADYCVSHLANNLLGTYRQSKETIWRKLKKLQESAKKGGKDASEIGLVHSADIEALKRALTKAFQLTDANYLNLAQRKSLNDGCTALVVLLYGPDEDGSLKVLTAHAGDCRAVLCRDRVAIRLTEDHKPNKREERKRIEAAGGKVGYVKGIWRVVTTLGNRTFGLSTARSIGDLPMKSPKVLVPATPDVKVLQLDFYRDMFIILGSDGVWDTLSDQEACDIVCNHITSDCSPQAAADALVHVAKERGSCDDKTATVIFFGWRRDLFGSPSSTAAENPDNDDRFNISPDQLLGISNEDEPTTLTLTEPSLDLVESSPQGEIEEHAEKEKTAPTIVAIPSVPILPAGSAEEDEEEDEFDMFAAPPPAASGATAEQTMIAAQTTLPTPVAEMQPQQSQSEQTYGLLSSQLLGSATDTQNKLVELPNVRTKRQHAPIGGDDHLVTVKALRTE